MAPAQYLKKRRFIVWVKVSSYPMIQIYNQVTLTVSTTSKIFRQLLLLCRFLGHKGVFSVKDYGTK